MVNTAKNLILIECDIPTKAFIQKVDEDLRAEGRGQGDHRTGSWIREDLDDTHLLIYKELLEPMRQKLDERNRANTFDRDS
ncbi:hypothetical protein KFE25_010096 [Diacronema lutheri]|uniref:General transcription and DNA repair factor IIH subunit TFB5 n=1 Tax=Diacronema lutheri TaxID=2081491 RepID=A0A8J5XI16_DIALT|nr:hypothetical protein KFE25_010096 [Diacronema lutheri]|mmetsp:Transcript_3482/g.10888  ORF Transcript_3482/g.10888 Transcript_3482/m.10888 type:complete len:81 (+) Transcript_3482:114-356(+)